MRPTATRRWRSIREESETTLTRWRRARAQIICAGGDRRSSRMQATYLLISQVTTFAQSLSAAVSAAARSAARNLTRARPGAVDSNDET